LHIKCGIIIDDYEDKGKKEKRKKENIVT